MLMTNLYQKSCFWSIFLSNAQGTLAVLVWYDYCIHTCAIWCPSWRLFFVYFSNLSLAHTVSLVKSAKGQIIGLVEWGDDLWKLKYSKKMDIREGFKFQLSHPSQQAGHVSLTPIKCPFHSQVSICPTPNPQLSVVPTCSIAGCLSMCLAHSMSTRPMPDQ